MFEKQLSYQALLDGLGQGVLIFDSDDKLVMDNVAARTLLGAADLKQIRTIGWSAAATLFGARVAAVDDTAEFARKQALASTRPARFHIFRAGEYVPCWAAAVHGSGGAVFTMITIEVADWSAIHELLTRFREEVQTAANSTHGHTTLITQSLKATKPGETVEQLSRRIGGFVQLISTHMRRIERFMSLLERLEMIRTGRINEQVRVGRKRLVLGEFIEDFIEGLDETQLLDPETETQDYRSRISTQIPDQTVVAVSPAHVTAILHDLLRNAIMYSLKATPVQIKAQAQPETQTVQIDVVDEGYGIRAKEFERVFELFKRARQPQIIGEFGYGLSLYLCKHEVEAMNGKIWFASEENVGTTFSFKLPLWREADADSPASSSSSPASS